jgi:putative hydrolase of the HAD superfamily
MATPYPTVLLDLYDTLAWSDWEVWQGVLARELGITAEQAARAFDVTRPSRSVGANPDGAADLAAVIREAGVEVSPERLVWLYEQERAHIQDGLHLFDESLAVLRALRARGVKTALVSNCSHNTRPGVDRLRLEDEMDAVVLSFEVGARKPEPAIYLEALRALGANADDAVFVDDQPAYCDGAAALGIDTLLIVRDREPLEGRSSSTNAHRVITSLDALV